MSELVVKPSLDSLPPEVLGFILPAFEDLEGRYELSVAENLGNRQQWLPFKRHWEEQIEFIDPTASQNVLRALSQTCRSLRAVALPRLWSIVHVKRVSELGKLNEILKEAPYIAPLIRHFAFYWDMNEDYIKCDAYDKQLGSLLDMAFIDRGALWDHTRAELGCPIEIVFVETERVVDSHFRHDGAEYAEPGAAPDWWEDIDEDLDDEECEEIYDQRGPNLQRAGPDGRGQDKRIKDPQELVTCVTEVVAQLKSLEAFRWCCPVFAMPDGVFQALKLLPDLTTLHVDMASRRGMVHSLPLWELASKLKYLSLTMRHMLTPRWTVEIPEQEVSEAELLSFELPEHLPVTQGKLNALHDSIASRTVVAAARGGQLRGLEIQECSVQRPFAVRALLPFWVGVKFDDWAAHYHRLAYPEHKWLSARSSLRPALAHLSLWRPGSDPRTDRKLSMAEVRGLAAHFAKRGTPNVVEPEHDSRQGRDGKVAPHPLSIGLYLPWLAEDAELAQQVADAWNAVVERGEADEVMCRCERCQPDLPPRPSLAEMLGAIFGVDLEDVSDEDFDSEDEYE